MKTLKNGFLLIASLSIIISCGTTQTTAQKPQNDNNNFEIVNDMIYWRYVYDNKKNINQLKKNPKLDFVTDTTGYIIKTNFNDKELKYLTGEFLIQEKENKYRVSVFNVMFYVDPMTLNSGSVSMQTISEHTIEESLIKNNGQIRKSFFGYKLTEILNPHLIELFTIKDYGLNDDW